MKFFNFGKPVEKPKFSELYFKSVPTTKVNFIQIETHCRLILDLCSTWCSREEDQLLKTDEIDPTTSALRNLMIFNLESLRDLASFNQFERLLTPTTIQGMANRLQALATSISLRIDADTVDILIDRMILIMKRYYAFSDEEITRCFTLLPYIWLIPFVQQSWTPKQKG